MDWSELRSAVAAFIAPTGDHRDHRDQEDTGKREVLREVIPAREEESPLYVDSAFAREWYLMRERGEHDRAAALALLYQNRPEPGGPYPDPRLPAAFSSRAVLGAVAKLKGVSIWPAPSDENEHTLTRKHRLTMPVWLVTYAKPREKGAQRERPTIAVLQQQEEELMLWSAACMLGFLTREPWRVSDPATPAGTTPLPSDPANRALFHRYAHALMLAEFDCSQVFGCPCTDIARQLNAVPPDHPQATMTIPAQRVRPIISKPRQPANRASPSGPLPCAPGQPREDT